MIMKKAGLLIGAALISAQVMAHDFTAGDIHIDHPWSRALPPVAPTGAAYMIIENRGDQADILVGAASPVAAHAELHEHVHQDGLMKMQQIEKVEIAPGEQLSFKPGGHHIMLFNLNQPLTAGEEFPLTLEFQRAGKVEVQVHVTAEEPGDASHDDHAHH